MPDSSYIVKLAFSHNEEYVTVAKTQEKASYIVIVSESDRNQFLISIKYRGEDAGEHTHSIEVSKEELVENLLSSITNFEPFTLKVLTFDQDYPSDILTDYIAEWLKETR